MPVFTNCCASVSEHICLTITPISSQPGFPNQNCNCLGGTYDLVFDGSNYWLWSGSTGCDAFTSFSLSCILSGGNWIWQFIYTCGVNSTTVFFGSYSCNPLSIAAMPFAIGGTCCIGFVGISFTDGACPPPGSESSTSSSSSSSSSTSAALGCWRLYYNWHLGQWLLDGNDGQIVYGISTAFNCETENVFDVILFNDCLDTPSPTVTVEPVGNPDCDCHSGFLTPCCPDTVLPDTLYATITDLGACACLATPPYYVLHRTGMIWTGTALVCGGQEATITFFCTGIGETVAFYVQVACGGGTSWSNTYTGFCEPFDIVFTGFPAMTGTCCTGDFTMEITE